MEEIFWNLSFQTEKERIEKRLKTIIKFSRNSLNVLCRHMKNVSMFKSCN